MIQITITEVKSARVRTHKALAVARIEVIDQLGFNDIKGCRSFSVHVHHDPPDHGRVRWQTTLEGFDPRNASHWHLIRDALVAVLPKTPVDEDTIGALPRNPAPDAPRPALPPDSP